MITVKPECQDNAIGMLQSKHSRFLGWVANIRYYLVDGKVWSWPFGGDAKVCRSDSSHETDAIVKMVRDLSVPFTHKELHL